MAADQHVGLPSPKARVLQVCAVPLCPPRPRGRSLPAQEARPSFPARANSDSFLFPLCARSTFNISEA